MTTSTSTSPLTHALVITHEMLVAAQEGDWAQLQHLEEAREPLLRRQHPADATSQSRIGEILAYDQRLQSLLGEARDAAARQWQQERDRSQAIAAYVQG